MTYYNTTNESGQALHKFKKEAKSQDRIIFDLFSIDPSIAKSKKLSASLIHRQTNILLTSVRRSLHTLEKEGKLRRLNVKITGLYGRSEYMYTKS